MEIILIIIIVILAYLVYNAKTEAKSNPENTTPKPERLEQALPYQKKHLFTKTEYKFYMYLKSIAAEEKLTLFAKVRLEDFIETTSTDNKMKYRGYIRSRHIDFLVCDDKLNILCAIELDGPSHYNKKSQEIDTFKNKLFETIKIPLYRVKTDSDYNAVIENIIKSIKTTNPEGQDN
ncbi:MAG: DUF2726 domain-containing protein [Lachnospiraceae bacterium]|nr:DUF2726 domain-containing protein [Lachnospiraceae bacterium]